MDDKQIMNELRGLALAEPLLGFDPDDVATKAAKRVRNRRATLIAGVGTLAVIGAAVTAVTFAGLGSAQVAARPATATSPTSAESPLDIETQQARNRRHLADVLGKVLVGAQAIDIQALDNKYGNDLPMTTYVVSYRDGTGPASFNLTITAPTASQAMPKLADQCNPAVGQEGLNKKTSRCDKLSQPDGSTLVVQEIDSLQTDSRAVPKVMELDAIHYRTDGSTVNIINDVLVSDSLAARVGQPGDSTGESTMRPKAPLTEQQLTTLVTDPAFSLK